MKTFEIESLGCSKNLVDSEVFYYILLRNGYDYASVDDNRPTDLFILNTCSFIATARKETMDYLSCLVNLKKKAKISKIAVTGCMVKSNLSILRDRFPEVDAWINLKDFHSFEKFISGRKLDTYHRICFNSASYAYLRISDGCNNRCSYCKIPAIRGKHRSVPMEDLVREALYLANQGYRELVIIAQDITTYGKDVYGRMMLGDLLKRLHEVPGIGWIRLMYMHPAHIKRDLIETIANLPKILPVFEIPLQHCNSKILAAMNRPYTKEDILNLFSTFKEIIPDSLFRTTFITGFPGETSKQFNELLQFVEDNFFIRMGVFAYSREFGTPAFSFANQVSERTALNRNVKLMQTHCRVTENYLNTLVGKEVEVIVDEHSQEGKKINARAWFDAPEVDGNVELVYEKATVNYGDILSVKIDDVIGSDLYGKIE